MKAIKIDVEQRKVYEVEISGSNKSMYEALKCTCFTHIAIVPREEFLWLDDDGLVTENPIGAFEIKGYPQVLSGNGLVLGIDAAGYNRSTSLSVESIEENITWKDVVDLPKPSFRVFSL